MKKKLKFLTIFWNL